MSYPAAAENHFVDGDSAEEAGDFRLALQYFEQGAASGHAACLERLGHMYDHGTGVERNKRIAMQCYQKAWRQGGHCAANNIAVLYRERGDLRNMVRWFKRAIEQGDEDARVELAKAYLGGIGVRRSISAAISQLHLVIQASHATRASVEEAETILRTLNRN